MQDRPPYSPVLARLRRFLDDLVAEVAHDVAVPGEDPADLVPSVRPVVTWTMDALAEAQELQPARLATLRTEGARAAASGESLQRLLDRYLSTGWVVWGAATRADPRDATIPALGTALLKAGDAAAAAIAGGYGEAERALAVRAAGARRQFVDDLLDLRAGDAGETARLRRRASDFGLDPGLPRRVVVAALGHDVPDGSPELETIADAFGPRGPREGALVAGRRGHVVAIVPGDRPIGPAVEATLDRLGGGTWLAVVSPVVAALPAVADAYAGVRDAIVVGERLSRRGLIDADDLALERALVADESLLAAAVARELGPILRAPRNARGLTDTLQAYLGSGQNLRATARFLGVAPRTVAYRLERIEVLLGGPLRGERVLRVAAALLGGLADPRPDAAGSQAG